MGRRVFTEHLLYAGCQGGSRDQASPSLMIVIHEEVISLVATGIKAVEEEGPTV